MASSLKAQFDVTVYGGTDISGAYNWSPFVTKLEARFRFGGLPYRTAAGSMSKSPRSKIPYVAISKKGSQDAPRVLGDSTLIADQLVAEGVLDDLNAKLSQTDRGLDLAFRALMEDKLYWYICYERWHQNYHIIRAMILAKLPYLMQVIIGLFIYRTVMRTLYGQGTTRYTVAELGSFKRHIWENIEGLLAAARSKKVETDDDQAPFWILKGAEPSEADASLFGFIATALVCDAGPETRKIVRSLPSVMDYAQRIHNRYFPDYEYWD